MYIQNWCEKISVFEAAGINKQRKITGSKYSNTIKLQKKYIYIDFRTNFQIFSLSKITHYRIDLSILGIWRLCSTFSPQVLADYELCLGKPTK